MDYCTRDDIEDQFGAVNVAKWADMDNTQDADRIASRIAGAISQVSAAPAVAPAAPQWTSVDPQWRIDLLAAYSAGGLDLATIPNFHYCETVTHLEPYATAARNFADQRVKEGRPVAYALPPVITYNATPGVPVMAANANVWPE